MNATQWVVWARPGVAVLSIATSWVGWIGSPARWARRLAQEMAARLDEKRVYVAPFSFPVVPRGQDRILTQLSAAHSRNELDRAIDEFI